MVLLHVFNRFLGAFCCSKVSPSGLTSIRGCSSMSSGHCTPSDLHIKCRYPNPYVFKDTKDDTTHRIVRQEVPDDKVSWTVAFDNYDPVEFEAPHLKSAPYADPCIGQESFHPRWNQVDGAINRKSHEGVYQVQDGRPLNPHGRTGLKGRGLLGRYGPNHAADPIVTRWARNGESGEVLLDEVSQKPILEFVAIQRRDTNEWAIPGGMVDPGELVSQTVMREFMEEAMDCMDGGSCPEVVKKVQAFFERGRELYKGYVDDPRNTDNAWMETVAFMFHDNAGKEVAQLKLKAGDDAKALKWTRIGRNLKLYASHADFLKSAAQALSAHW